MTTTVKTLFTSIISITLAGGALFGAHYALALSSLNDIDSGDLIRGESFSAVYYMGADGFRYVFPNDKTYFTWYENFDSVKWISDSDLATIQIGGNVTYKPGAKMIKITSDPSTYAVASGGVLRHVTTEAIAIELYGTGWNKKIDDVPDGFFTNYTVGDAIEEGDSYNPAMEKDGTTSINDDKELVAPQEISITADGFSPNSVTIEANQTVRFTNNDTEKHSATSDNLTWGTGTITTDGDYVQRFKKAGEYPFFDSYDSSNTGAVYVE